MPHPAANDDVLYVCLGKDVKESEAILTWALHNSRGMKICILHVHKPAQRIPMMGASVPVSRVEENQVKAYHEIERQDMHKLLDKYIRTCLQAGVEAEKLVIEMDSIEKGIIQLISELGIKWLVMGAAASKSYSRKMKEPKSRKAISVHLHAPSFCYIWFICKGKLVHIRESKLGELNTEAEPPPFQPSPSSGSSPQSLRSQSAAEGGSGQINIQGSVREFRRLRSDNHGMQHLAPSTSSAGVSGRSSFSSEQNFDWDSLSWRSHSVASRNSASSSGEIIEDLALSHFARTEEEKKIGVKLAMSPQTDDDHPHFSALSSTTAKASETMYGAELRRLRIEAALARGREDAERMKNALNEVMEELRIAQEQKFDLECQVADWDKVVEEMEQKMFRLQIERDNALKLAEELRKRLAADASSVPQFLEFSLSEIEAATSNFSQAFKIGEGAYGNIYRAHLRHTEVAIQMLDPNGLQGPFEFQQEVNILSKLRHPNIVTLIGACTEACALIFEHLSNGSLEDRLNCKNKTPPLPWKTRIRIAKELCSVLIFLHSCRPRGIIYGDLKPANILLDTNFVTKLGDFGICREYKPTLGCGTDSKETSVYIDPEFQETGELTTASDVYSFGLILLRLLTGRPAVGLPMEVQCALDKGSLTDLLDSTAGDWPYEQAEQLARLAIDCCSMNRGDRPDLACEVWRVLEPMTAS